MDSISGETLYDHPNGFLMLTAVCLRVDQGVCSSKLACSQPQQSERYYAVLLDKTMTNVL